MSEERSSDAQGYAAAQIFFRRGPPRRSRGWNGCVSPRSSSQHRRYLGAVQRQPAQHGAWARRQALFDGMRLPSDAPGAGHRVTVGDDGTLRANVVGGVPQEPIDLLRRVLPRLEASFVVVDVQLLHADGV